MRVLKLQTVGMQELTTNLKGRVLGAINSITCNGVADISHVYSYLVSAASF